MKKKVILFVVTICSIVGICIAICLALPGFAYYNNQFYAQRVIEAMEQEDSEELHKLMDYPFGNLNSKDKLWIAELASEEAGRTPLQVACRIGDPEIVELLLENGADVNYIHWDEIRRLSSPLSRATGSLSDKRLEVVKLLVEHGADVNYETSNNDALSCAVYACFDRDDTIEILEYLEENGADIYKKYSGTQDTLLHKACEKDEFLIIRYLVEERGLDINAVNEDGDTPLIYFLRFASERDEDTLLFLIENGADQSIKNKEGKTAYDYAVERHPEFTELLEH